MGRDKLSLVVGDAPLIERVANVLAARCDEVLVVGGGEAVPGCRSIPDRRPGEGPLAGIESSLLAARNRRVFVAAGDMPFLSEDLVGYLLGLLDRDGHPAHPAAVPRFETREHPLCAAYDVQQVLPRLSAALDRGERTVRAFLVGLPGVAYVGGEELSRFGDPGLLLMNVNTPEDLARARMQAQVLGGMP